MPFKDLDAAWADFKAETMLTGLLGDDAAAEHYLRIIFSAGAVAGLAVVTAHVAEGDDTISLTMLIGQLMAASDHIHADMTRLTGGAPPATDQTLAILQRLGEAHVVTIRQTYTYAELDVSAATYDEIAGKLRAAGYDHAFLDYNRVEGRTHSTIDMHGIGLVRASQEEETVMRYVTTRVVEAIQWNGPHTLEDVQKFLAGGTPAASPYWNGSGNMTERLAVPVPDRNEDSRWPTMGPHFKMEHIALGDWILRDEAGNLSTMAGVRFAAECSPVPEAAAASLVSAMAAMNEPDVEEPPAAPAIVPVDEEL